MSGPQDQSEPIASTEWERFRDAEWAMHDPEIQQRYSGNWVVAYERRIIAHGMDARAVAEYAGQAVPDMKHLLVFCAGVEPDDWLAHTSDDTLDFLSA